MKNKGDHFQVSNNAFSHLATWQKEKWKHVEKEFMTTYSGYVDTLSPAGASPEECLSKEPRYKELLYIDGKFCQVALAGSIRYYAPLVRYAGGFQGDQIIEQKPFQHVYGRYLEMLVKYLKAEDHDMAAKVAGVVSHLLCDHNPGDHIDPAQWTGLIFPPSPDLAPEVPDCWGVVRMDVDIPQVEYKPQLLGVTISEATHGFYQRYLSHMKHGIPYISRMLNAAYQKKHDEVKKLLSEVRLFGIEILSDFLYTAFSIAYSRFEKRDIENLEPVKLSSWFPMINEMDFIYFHGPYKGTVIEFFKGGAKKVKAELLVTEESGCETVVREIDDCLSVLPDSGNQLEERWAKLVYDLSGAEYQRFTCLAGMPPRQSVSGNNDFKGRVEVLVMGDDEVLFEQRMNGGEPAINIDANISGKKQLTLIVRGLHQKPQEFWLGQFIWGNPRLLK